MSVNKLKTLDGELTHLAGAPASKGIFKGSSSSDDGDYGYVPAPSSDDRNKFLKGDGTWGQVTSPRVLNNTLYL